MQILIPVCFVMMVFAGCNTQRRKDLPENQEPVVDTSAIGEPMADLTRTDTAAR
jgi:hypothetical protein